MDSFRSRYLTDCLRCLQHVLSAGYGYRAAVEEAELADVEKLFATNVHGPVELIQRVLPGMREHGSRTIVNVSSIAANVRPAGCSFYAASKAALEGISGALAKEVGPLGIRVIAVEPGGFRTDFAGRSLTQSEAAISAYADTAGKRRKEHDRTHGTQPGDPAKAAQALITAVESETPPSFLLFGTDARKAVTGVLEDSCARSSSGPSSPTARTSTHERPDGDEAHRGDHRRIRRHRRCHCPRPARHRYSVALLARRLDRIEGLAAELGEGAIAIQADVTDRDPLVAAAHRVQDELGGAAVLVNNAGVMLFGPFSSERPEDYRAMVEANLLGAITATEVFLDQLKDEGGDLVNISSVAGRTARATNGVYAATKWGINGWSESLRQELLPDVRVTLIEPGMVDTELPSHITDQ